jgi:hypothetical protein
MPKTQLQKQVKNNIKAILKNKAPWSPKPTEEETLQQFATPFRHI